jgi:hypothetical protein
MRFRPSRLNSLRISRIRFDRIALPGGFGQIVAAVAALIQATAHIARTALALRPFKRAHSALKRQKLREILPNK